MTGDLVERIYEAAFVPELWPGVLANVGTVSGSASGELQIIRDGEEPRWQATENTRPILGEFIASGEWRNCERPRKLMSLGYSGFLCDADYLAPDQLARDPAYIVMSSIGLGWQLGTLIPMPTGEIVGLTFERSIHQDRPTSGEVAALDDLRPHLARSALIAARMGLERVQATISAFEAMGLPAAVLMNSGKVLTANHLFEAMESDFLPAAFGDMAFADAGANLLFQQVIDAAQTHREPLVRSIPIAARGDRAALVVHVLPLRRAAHDIFSGADILVVVTTVSASNMVPSPNILMGLFDLTPSEVKLAVALTAGRSVKEAAAASGVTVKTSQTYLERIFAKTGTHQQSQLVALLKSASFFTAADSATGTSRDDEDQ